MVEYKKDNRILTNIAKSFEKRLKINANVTLVLDESLGEFCGKYENGVLSAGSYGQLLEVCGRFLRHPKMAEGTFHSAKKICGMYFATHFDNYTDAAPLEEIFEYMDDLAFWGMNTFKLWFDLHHFRNMGEGRHKVSRLKKMIQHAKSMGVKTILTILANEAFADSVEALRADWTCGHDGYIHDLNDHYHLEICPSKPGGMDLIKSYRRQMLEEFRDVEPDYIAIGAYDEGGCSCSACAPWGSNGYIRTVKELIPIIKEYFPHTKLVLNTWQFGTFTGTDIEYEGLAEALHDEVFSEVEFLVAEPQYASYPFTHEMGRPIIGFPEISMFHASPWGGYGANPMPRHLEELWRNYGDKLEGGLPYSEGLYEDLNKVIMLRNYRDNQPAEVTIKEYLSYEFGLVGEQLEIVCQALTDMEETLERDWDTEERERNKKEHRYVIKNPEKAEAIEKIIREVHSTLPEAVQNCKKWQLIYLRAKIDGELVRNDFYRNDTVLGYFNELIELSHLQNSGPYTKPDVMA